MGCFLASVKVTPEASSVVTSISETDRWIMRKARRKGLTSGGAPIKMALPEAHPSPQDRWLWPPQRVSQGQEVALTHSQLCITIALFLGSLWCEGHRSCPQDFPSPPACPREFPWGPESYRE